MGDEVVVRNHNKTSSGSGMATVETIKERKKKRSK